jgi:hypothetical protein
MKTDHLDPFALAGRNGETATALDPNCAGEQPRSAVRIASLVGDVPAELPPKEHAMPDTHIVLSHGGETDVELRSMFCQWVERERAFAEKLTHLSDEEAECEIDQEYEREDFLFNNVVKRPAEGAVGLAIKAFLALHTRYGNGDLVPSVHGGAWTGENAHYACSLVERALAGDLVRFIPELIPLLAKAMTAEQKNPAEDDETIALSRPNDVATSTLSNATGSWPIKRQALVVPAGDAIAETQEIAMMEFEPMDNAALLDDLTEPRWGKMITDFGVHLRIAAVTMGQTKAQTIALCRDLLKNENESLFDLLGGFTRVDKQLRMLADILKGAFIRMQVGGSAAALLIDEQEDTAGVINSPLAD